MSDSWMQYNGIFNIRNSVTENQQHYDRKIVQFGQCQCHFQHHLLRLC